MTCTVTLCDNSFSPVPDTAIQIHAYIPSPYNTVLQTLPNGPLQGPNYGATLTKMGTNDIYDIIIDTTGTPYAPLTLASLNGRGSPQLDVVLLSTGGARRSFARPTSSTALASFIQGQSWPEEAKRAVLISMATLSYVKRPPGAPFPTLRRNIEALLDSLGIDFTQIP